MEIQINVNNKMKNRIYAFLSTRIAVKQTSDACNQQSPRNLCLNMSEKICLQWNDFNANVNKAFENLRKDFDFADVTLACEDGQQLEAHKVVLAASSPFFQEILKRNKHSHPLIYMRATNSVDLVAMVDFLYFGEANVDQENLDSFLAIAEELQLKGLQGSYDQHRLQVQREPQHKKTKQKYGTSTTQMISDETTETKEITSTVLKEDRNELGKEDNNVLATIQSSGDLQQLDETVKSMMKTKESTSTVLKEERNEVRKVGNKANFDGMTYRERRAAKSAAKKEAIAAKERLRERRKEVNARGMVLDAQGNETTRSELQRRIEERKSAEQREATKAKAAKGRPFER